MLSVSDNLSAVLKFMRENYFSQVMVKGSDGRLSILSVAENTKWLADEMKDNHPSPTKGRSITSSLLSLGVLSYSWLPTKEFLHFQSSPSLTITASAGV